MSKYTESGVIEGIITEGQSLQSTSKTVQYNSKNIFNGLQAYIESIIDIKDVAYTLSKELKSLPILKGNVISAEAYHSTRDAKIYAEVNGYVTYSIPVQVEIKLKSPIDPKKIGGIYIPDVRVNKPKMNGNYLDFDCALKFKVFKFR